MNEPNQWYLASDKDIDGKPIKPFVTAPRGVVAYFGQWGWDCEAHGTGYIKATSTRLIVKVSVKTGRGGRRGRARRSRWWKAYTPAFDKALGELEVIRSNLSRAVFDAQERAIIEDLQSVLLGRHVSTVMAKRY